MSEDQLKIFMTIAYTETSASSLVLFCINVNAFNIF